MSEEIGVFVILTALVLLAANGKLIQLWDAITKAGPASSPSPTAASLGQAIEGLGRVWSGGSSTGASGASGSGTFGGSDTPSSGNPPITAGPSAGPIFWALNGLIRITQGYRVGTIGLPEFQGGPHRAVDLAAATGTPLFAPMTGTVTNAGSGLHGNGAYGNAFEVTSLDGTWKTIYGHMESFNVSVGQQVQAGQQVGLSDNTGYSTGPHVHYEVQHLVNGTWQYVNPLTLNLGLPNGQKAQVQ